MIGIGLTEEEREILENLATSAPDRSIEPRVRGRLGLYKLIDETPQGWKITALGRDALIAVGRSRREPARATSAASAS